MGNVKTSEDRINKLRYMSKDIGQNVAWTDTDMENRRYGKKHRENSKTINMPLIWILEREEIK